MPPLGGIATPVVLAGQVRGAEIHTVVLVAGRVEGTVHAVLTPLVALAVGAGFGLVVTGLRWLTGALMRRPDGPRRAAGETTK